MIEAPNLPSAATAYYFPELLKVDENVSAFYGELLRGMTHKLNNNLAVIQGFASLLMMNAGSGGAAFKDNIDHVKQAADNAKVLNERILSAGGCVRVSPQSLNLADYIPMVDRDLRKPCETAEVPFQLNLASSVPPVQVDSSRFKEVLLELLKNAADAVQGTGAGGEVALDILPPGQVPESIADHVDVFVRNSGSSIAPEKFEQIFKPFASTRDTSHFGIGLTTVRALCSQMNIRVGAKSENNTTTFWLSVPIA